MRYKRINLCAGPSSTKSSMAASIYGSLKALHFNVELCREFVKSFAYHGRKVNKWDQVYIFGQQQQTEYEYLNLGVDLIVTDSPVQLSWIYARYYKLDSIADYLKPIIDEYEKDFPSLNILIDRSEIPYNSFGRFQDEEEAKKLHTFIIDCMCFYFNHDNIEVIKAGDVKGVIDLINEK